MNKELLEALTILEREKHISKDTMLEAIDLGIDTIYLPDCCAGQTPEKEARVLGIADSFSPLHMQIMSLEDYLSC